jgi:hypothetical protein
MRRAKRVRRSAQQLPSGAHSLSLVLIPRFPPHACRAEEAKKPYVGDKETLESLVNGAQQREGGREGGRQGCRLRDGAAACMRGALLREQRGWSSHAGPRMQGSRDEGKGEGPALPSLATLGAPRPVGARRSGPQPLLPHAHKPPPDYRAYPVFVSKIRSLAARYGGIRRVRSDGNCFFRAAAFGLLEWLLVNEAEAECQRCVARGGLPGDLDGTTRGAPIVWLCGMLEAARPAGAARHVSGAGRLSLQRGPHPCPAVRRQKRAHPRLSAHLPARRCLRLAPPGSSAPWTRASSAWRAPGSTPSYSRTPLTCWGAR